MKGSTFYCLIFSIWLIANMILLFFMIESDTSLTSGRQSHWQSQVRDQAFLSRVNKGKPMKGEKRQQNHSMEFLDRVRSDPKPLLFEEDRHPSWWRYQFTMIITALVVVYWIQMAVGTRHLKRIRCTSRPSTYLMFGKEEYSYVVNIGDGDKGEFLKTSPAV